MTRLVIYGHASYYEKDEECVVPQGTTITFYAPPGALMDQTICSALVHGDTVEGKDVQLINDIIFFHNQGINIPKVTPLSELGGYPKTFAEGERIPNFYLKPADLPMSYGPPLRPTETTVHSLPPSQGRVFLSDLLQQFKGQNIHWAACSFVKDPSPRSIAYGYACKFAANSPLRSRYEKPALSEEEKKKKRSERFKSSQVDTSSTAMVTSIFNSSPPPLANSLVTPRRPASEEAQSTNRSPRQIELSEQRARRHDNRNPYPQGKERVEAIKTHEKQEREKEREGGINDPKAPGQGPKI
jgi:hypothetical protein